MLLKYILSNESSGGGVAKKSHGIRHRTRKKLKQRTARRPAITKFLQKFIIGQKVEIVPEPSSQKGMPHPRFRSRVGNVAGRRGKSYIVEIKDGGKKKLFISRPEHLKKGMI